MIRRVSPLNSSRVVAALMSNQCLQNSWITASPPDGNSHGHSTHMFYFWTIPSWMEFWWGSEGKPGLSNSEILQAITSILVKIILIKINWLEIGRKNDHFIISSKNKAVKKNENSQINLPLSSKPEHATPESPSWPTILLTWNNKRLKAWNDLHGFYHWAAGPSEPDG